MMSTPVYQNSHQTKKKKKKALKKFDERGNKEESDVKKRNEGRNHEKLC